MAGGLPFVPTLIGPSLNRHNLIGCENKRRRQINVHGNTQLHFFNIWEYDINGEETLVENSVISGLKIATLTIRRQVETSRGWLSSF